jgi:hypothetical protein
MTRINILNRRPRTADRKGKTIYHLVDRPNALLGNSGRFLLWAMRGWTHAAERRTCPPQALRRGFASMDALAALTHFHVAMALLNAGGIERLALAPVGCPRIGEDEAILIGLWHDVASDRGSRARSTLALIVEPRSVAPIAAAMAEASAELTAAGLELAHLSLQTTRHQDNRSS